MWKETDYDHAIIQTTVVGIDEVEPYAEQPGEVGLLSFATSYVMENYVRPNEYAVFGSELKVGEADGYEVTEVTQILEKGLLNPRAVFLRSETYLLGPDFKPVAEGVTMNQVSRQAVGEFISRKKGARPFSKI